MSGKIVDSEYKLKSDYQSICRDIANTILTHDESLNLLSIKEIDKIIKSKSSYHKLPCIPKYSEILRFLPAGSQYKSLLRIKPVKTQSGVAVVTVMPMPYDCPHGKCIYCPGGKEFNTPLSYIGTEPATKIAQQVNYDPFEQVRSKIIQLFERGHEVSKAELVIVGGTFPFYPVEYQLEFVKKCYDGLNSFDDIFFEAKTDKESASDHKENVMLRLQEQLLLQQQQQQEQQPPSPLLSTDNLSPAQNHLTALFQALTISKKRNETSSVRCVGLTVETKPDYCKQNHVDLMLQLGTTRIELGIQSLNENVYKKVNRGHNLKDVYRAFFTARNSGYKIGAHMMPGLPGSNIEQDISDAKTLFEDSRLRPDMLKIYPTLVVPNTGLYELYKKKKYESYDTEDLVNLLVEIKKIIPPWVRIMRIQREVEPRDVVAGPKMGNIRQLVLNKLKKEGIKCKCIRCREIGLMKERIEFSDNDIELSRIEYMASGGKEIFLSFEIKNTSLLLGFLRLRLMPNPIRVKLPSDFVNSGGADGDFDYYGERNENEIAVSSAIVRELHVYGQVAKIEKPDKFTLYEDNNKLYRDYRERQSTLEASSIDYGILNSNKSDESLDGLTNFNHRPPTGSGNLKYQHKGLGKALLAEAEKICKREYNLRSLSVISAVGTRDYYRKFGYTNNGPYVTKRM